MLFAEIRDIKNLELRKKFQYILYTYFFRNQADSPNFLTIKFLLPVRLSARQASRYYARPFTALNEPDAKTFSMRIRRKQRGIEPAGE